MWQCPKCETLNDGEACILCGEAKPIPRVEIIQKEATVIKKETVTARDERTEDLSKYIKRTSALMEEHDKDITSSSKENNGSIVPRVVVGILGAAVLILLLSYLF